MEKLIVESRASRSWIVLGVAVLLAHIGCNDLSGLQTAREGGVGDGKSDGKGKETGSTGGVGGSRTGGSAAGASGSAGSGGSPQTGGNASSSTSTVDAAVPVGGSSGGIGGGIGGGIAGSTGGKTGGSGGTSQAGTGGTKVDAAIDLPTDRPVDAAPDGPSCTSAASCPAPTGGNGIATCLNGQCGMSCNSGYHRCGDTCASNTSVQTCGTSCTACAAGPTGSTPTCTGSTPTCGFTCNTGYHGCGSTCVVNGSTSVSSCGNNCTVCQAPTNGAVSCNGSACVLACNANYHLCGETCVANSSVSGCGNSCTACPTTPHGSSTCNGSPLSCGISCEATGYHKCGSECLSNTSPSSCGTSCTACPTDPHGSPTCNGTDCGIACNTGFHWCGGQCVSNTAVENCGSSCSPCPTQDAGSHSHATCSAGGACGIECDTSSPGYHNCGGTAADPTCVPNDDLASCGSRCSPCVAPASNGQVACTGGACTVTCDSTFHKCGTTALPTCLPDNDVNSCGTRCGTCPTPVHAVAPTCSGTPPTCGFTCNPDYHVCGTGGNASCEADSPTNCGASCSACPGGNICVNNTCMPPDAGTD